MLQTLSALLRLIPTNRLPFNMPKWYMVDKGFKHFTGADVNTNFTFHTKYPNLLWSAKGFPDILTRHLLFEGYYQLDVLSFIHQYLKPGDTFLDVGGHHGLMAITAAKAVGPQGKVITVEPNPNACRFIELHRDLNGISNLTIEPIGFSNTTGEIAFYVQKGEVTWNSTIIADFVDVNDTEKTEKITIRLDTLDHYITAHQLQPKAIKIDVEGAEFLILEGAVNTLDKLRPVVSMEFNPVSAKAAKSTVEHYVEVLRKKDYKMVVLTKGPLGFFSIYRYEPFIVAKHCSEDQLKNVLCIPAEKMIEFVKK